MKILIISGCFDPELTPRSYRTTELVKEFVRRGHDVTLYLPRKEYNHEEFVKKYPITIRYYRIAKDNFSGKKGIINRIIARVAYQFFSYPDLTLLRSLPNALKSETGEYDLLLSIVAPHAIDWALGRMYRKGKRLARTWIADCGDPFMLEGNWHIYRPFWFKKWEKQWCQLCDYITVPHEGAKDGYYPEFCKKIRIAPQSISFDEIVLNEYHPNVVPTFAYSGSVVKEVCDPRNLLEYLANKDIPFLFHIYTNQPELYGDYVRRLGERLKIHPYKPRLELLKDLSTMDFLVNFKLNNTVQASSKMIDYSLVKRPVLYITYHNMDENKVEQFLKSDYSQQYIVDNVERFDTKNVVQQFFELYNEKMSKK